MGRRQEANLYFHFAGSGENLPDIAKSRDASMDNKEFSSLLHILMKQNSFLFQATSCHLFSSGLPTNCTKAFHVIRIKSCNNRGVTEGNSQTVSHRYRWVSFNP